MRAVPPCELSNRQCGCGSEKQPTASRLKALSRKCTLLGGTILGHRGGRQAPRAVGSHAECCCCWLLAAGCWLLAAGCCCCCCCYLCTEARSSVAVSTRRFPTTLEPRHAPAHYHETPMHRCIKVPDDSDD